MFKLKTGAKFANGDPVRPEHVAYSFVRAVKLADFVIPDRDPMQGDVESVEVVATILGDRPIYERGVGRAEPALS